MQRKSLFLLLIFLVLSSSIVFVGKIYKSSKLDEYLSKQYNFLATSLNREVTSLIKEKKNATLALVISLSQSHKFEEIIQNNNYATAFLNKVSKKLNDATDFKDVWIQIIDKDGTSRARSWTQKRGDNLVSAREDVASMIKNPHIQSTISVGKFDIAFKAMVPFFDKNFKFIGFIEVITHFNSIANKIEEKDFEPVILVDKKYKNQIIHPMTNIFAGDYYIINKESNKKFVDYISQKGLAHFISPSVNYIVDHDQDLLVVNYILFDTYKKPLAYFLMFKPLQNIDFSSANTLESNINLLMLFSIFIIGVIFYFLLDEEKTSVKIEIRRIFYFFIFLCIAACTVYFLLLSWYFENKKNDFISNYNKNIQADYKIINNSFSKLANSMFETVIKKPDVLEIMAMAYKGDEQKKMAREKLFKRFSDEYEYFKKYGFIQLHFHLKDNESFLRFHRPEKYGDNLTDIRATVKWVNENLVKIKGFEEGRIFNGFRQVFPLVRVGVNGDKEHIGSVELSFSAYTLAEEFTKIYKAEAEFIITSDVVDKKVFMSEQSNYIKSDFKGFLYEKRIKKQLEQTFTRIDISQLTKRDIVKASQRISKGEVFSVISKDSYSIFTFIPFKNPVSKKVVAAIIVQKESIELSNRSNQYLILMLAGIGSILFVFLYIYKEFSSRRKFQELSRKNQKILDTQESIVVITTGINIIEANRKFLDFFGFEDLTDFKKVHKCISDYFEEDDKFFHLAKVPEGEFWMDTLSKLTNKEHIVSMEGKEGEPHSFSVLVNNFEENYILSFSDISGTMREHFSLERKAMHDKLTNAKNREYFEKVIRGLIEESSKQGFKLGIMLLDVDHFKLVNDTYGHNVGDSVLKHLVETIHKTIRTEDMLIRWGGEEFLLIAKTNSLNNTIKMGEHLRKTVEDKHFEDVGRITCSFGVTLYKENEDIKECIKRADEALYEAKNRGRNIVVIKE